MEAYAIHPVVRLYAVPWVMRKGGKEPNAPPYLGAVGVAGFPLLEWYRGKGGRKDQYQTNLTDSRDGWALSTVLWMYLYIYSITTYFLAPWLGNGRNSGPFM